MQIVIKCKKWLLTFDYIISKYQNINKIGISIKVLTIKYIILDYIL